MGRKQKPREEHCTTVSVSIPLSLYLKIPPVKNRSAFIVVAIKERLSRLDGINPEIEHDTAALQEAIDRYESVVGEQKNLENTITTLKEKISKRKPKKGDKP